MASVVFPAAVGPQMMRSSASTKAALDLVPGEMHDRRAAVDVVRRERRGGEGDVQRAHLTERERIASLDGGLAGERRREMLVARGGRRVSTPCERVERFAQAARRIEAGVRHGDAAHDERMSTEALDLEAQPLEEIAMLLEGVSLRGSQMQRDRKEQPLRGRLTAL